MSTTTRRYPPLWANISFMLMWSSVAASGFGDRLIMLAAEPMLGVYKEGASAASIQAGIAFFFFFPYLLLTVFGGWLADRLPRKWLMLACDEGRAVVLLIAFVMAGAMTTATAAAIPPAYYWRVYVIIAATGCFAAVFNPCRIATVPQIVPVQQLQPANAILAAITIVASLIGYKVGGYLVEDVSVRLAILVGALCYGISGWFFAFLKIQTHSPPASGDRVGLARQFVQSFGYVRRHAAVRNLVVLNVVFWTGSWIVAAAVAALTRSHYGLAVDTYISSKATMMALFGVGILASSVAMILIRTRRESGILALTGLSLAGLCMLGMALVPVYEVGLVFAALTGFTGGIFLICVDSLTQSLTPNYIRGRIFGLRSMLNTLATVIINWVIWRLPQGTADSLMIPALAVMACVLMLVGGWGLLRLLTSGPLQSWDSNVIWRIDRLYCLVWHRLAWSGAENVPLTGSVILAANHTTGIDPMLIQAPLPRMVRWVMYRPYQFRILNPLWRLTRPITVNQDGKDTSQIRTIIAAVKEGAAVGIFPEGGLQRELRELQPFQAGIGLVARKSGAAIVPIWVDGTPRTRSMIWHFLRPSHSRIAFGKPYHPDAAKSNEQVVEELRRRMLELADSLQQAAGGVAPDRALDDPPAVA